MKHRRKFVSLLLAGALFWSGVVPALASAQRVYYRYQNEQGLTTQTDRLPPAAARRGYSVVSASGDIIKVVPRELTVEERLLRDAALARDKVMEDEEKRIRKWDQSLILRYSNADEIDAARVRGIREFDTRISIFQGNLMSLKAQIEAEQRDAANYLRRGRQVPDTLSARITSLKGEVLYAEDAIGQIKRERIETEQQYEADRLRFLYLMEQAALRR